MRTTLLVLLAAVLWACSGALPAGDTIVRDDVPSREEHVNNFPIHVAPHADVDCNECHGQFDTFRQFSCTDCHLQPDTDPRHATVTQGYVFESNGCYRCHPRSEPEGFDHQVRFPIAPPSVHSGYLCTTCHPDPAVRSQFSCANSCHPADATGARHLGTVGYLWQSASCYACHPQGQ